MNKFEPKVNVLLIVTALAFVVAIFDYVVRTYTLGWTEAVISQRIVFFSPLVYVVLLILLLFNFRINVSRLSKRSVKIIAVLLFLYSAFLLAQVYLRHQGVGSASYSIVSPLFVSGIPISILTFLLFLEKNGGLYQVF